MPTFNEIKEKIRQFVCCVNAEKVDQNEGPPPPTTAAIASTVEPLQAQAQQGTSATIPEEADEEDWGNEETVPNPYKGANFVVEADEYNQYEYDKSPYAEFDQVQRDFDMMVQDYYPKYKNNIQDARIIWESRAYERPVTEWGVEQEANIPSRVQAAR